MHEARAGKRRDDVIKAVTINFELILSSIEKGIPQFRQIMC